MGRRGSLELYVAGKLAYQDLRVVELLQRGAHVYICGDALRMAPEVRATFERVAASRGLGDEYVDKLMGAGRYCQDVWALQSV